MIVTKIIFTKPKNGIPASNQKEVNSYIHRCIGENNVFHDAFSDYCISSLQGGKLNPATNMLEFDRKPYILFLINPKSKNFEIYNKLLTGVYSQKNKLFDMKYYCVASFDYKVMPKYDKIYMASPILLKKYDKENKKTIKVTCKDDGFIELLKANCINKLKHNGIVDETFDIVLRNPEKAKQKLIMVGDVFNPCTMASFLVYGKKETRDTLYSMGLGNSTGSGFGMIKVTNEDDL